MLYWGVPAIYLDDEGRGYTDEQEANYQLVYNFSESQVDQEKSIKKGVEILKNTKKKSFYIRQKEKLIKDKIDVTKFMVSLVENHKHRR